MASNSSSPAARGGSGGRTRDPAAKQQRLLEAALAEFAEHGLAGGKIERIASRAGVSTGLVYSFWESKQALFDAVLAAIAEQTAAIVPLDATDLPGYAARLHDAALAHPEVGRFLAWHRLERDWLVPAVEASLAAKVEAVAVAQQAGQVSGAMNAGATLAAVLALASMWQQTGEDLDSLVPEEQRRQIISDAVARLVNP